MTTNTKTHTGTKTIISGITLLLLAITLTIIWVGWLPRYGVTICYMPLIITSLYNIIGYIREENANS